MSGSSEFVPAGMVSLNDALLKRVGIGLNAAESSRPAPEQTPNTHLCD